MLLKPLLLLLCAFVVLSGCQNIPSRDPRFAPVKPADLRPPPQTTGAIYQAGYDVRLFEDLSARRVGDILTIVLSESTQAEKNSDMNLNKENATSVSIPTIFGMEGAQILGFDLQQSLNSSNNFTSTNKGKQNNQLRGTVSVSVVEVLPNGNLRVRGEKRISMTGGDEYVRLSGIIRPVDIDTSNTVESNRVADVTIMYVGEGPIQEAAQIGWLARFFNSPLFPF